MATNWQEYQDEAASFFRSIGLEASTNATAKGVRTSHDVDVLVKSTHVGFEVTWIVECKHWKTPVSKLHVLALREIVSDAGADRGILLCETGFQSGAIEAARLTNVQVTSLAAVTDSARNDIYAMRLRELYSRIETCNDRYWEIPKRQRIEYELRGDVGEDAYNGASAVDQVRDLLSRAFRGVYPFSSDSVAALTDPNFPKQFHSIQEVFAVAEPIVVDLERRLDAVKAANPTTEPASPTP